MSDVACPICQSECRSSIESHARPFVFCQFCEYIFQSPQTLPELAHEKQRYLEHNNDLTDPRYLSYLKKTWDQVPQPQPSAVVVDYGCGPTRGLETVLKENDFQVLSFDPIFWPWQAEPENASVDIVFCSEAIEHAFEPAKVFDHWNRLLKDQGWVTLRTCFHPGPENMTDWWYASDDTHVGFFNEKTFACVADRWGWDLIKIHSPYVVAVKNHRGLS